MLMSRSAAGLRGGEITPALSCAKRARPHTHTLQWCAAHLLDCTACCAWLRRALVPQRTRRTGARTSARTSLGAGSLSLRIKSAKVPRTGLEQKHHLNWPVEHSSSGSLLCICWQATSGARYSCALSSPLPRSVVPPQTGLKERPHAESKSSYSQSAGFPLPGQCTAAPPPPPLRVAVVVASHCYFEGNAQPCP